MSDRVPDEPATSPVVALREAPTERQSEILEGASRLFADYGFHGASVRDISRHVGISHPGMLHHYETKDALLHAVIDQLEDHAQGALDRVDELAASPDAFLREISEIWHPAAPQLQLLAMLTTDAVSEDHPGRFRMARLRKVHERVLQQCFERFESDGCLREGVDPAFAGRALMDLVLGHAVREKTVRAMQGEGHGDAPLADLAQLIAAFTDRRQRD